MKKYIGKRIISFLIVLVGVSILSFLLIAWSGKDPAEIIAHRGVSNPTPEQIEMIRVEMGLDQPLPVRYIQWLSGMFTGELGTSLTTHQPIVKDLHKYLATTTSLVGMAILWIIVLTVPISLLCARKRNRLFDQVTRGITICGICVPTFWLGFLLLLFFAIHLKWFSVLPSPGWRGFLLPSFALAVPSSCSLIRIMRSSLLAELSSDYVRFAKARGLSANRILVCHILRNALPPVVTIFFQQFGFLIAGGAVIESVFSIKGIGTYLVDSVIAADTIAVSTCIVVIAAIFVVANFMADIINRLLCPWMVREENDTYTFIRNPYYWGEAPEVDEFKVKVIPDNAAKILALRNGEIDAILGSSRLSAEGYTEISQDAAFGHAMDDSTNQTRYLGMNLNKAPFNDPLVREAVSYAVNQQELETSVFDGLETAAETLFTNEKPNCGVEVKTYPTDMEKAKQLMKEAGYEDTNDDGILEKDGTSLAIHFNYSQSLASVDNAVLSIAASLKELGFDVTIDAVDMNTWYGALMAGEYDLTFYNTAGGSFDPATDMSNMAPGAMGDPILCQFSAFFENPEIFAELDSTSDSQRVQEIYGMILNGIADQNLLVPVTGTHDLALWNTDKITGYDFYTDASYVDIASVHVK